MISKQYTSHIQDNSQTGKLIKKITAPDNHKFNAKIINKILFTVLALTSRQKGDLNLWSTPISIVSV